MTNKEKYQQVFGFPPDTASCPTDQCDICPDNDNFRCKSKVNFWDKEYTRPTVEPEITNEDLQNSMTESFKNGYEMAKAKFERTQGEWNYIQAGMEVCPFCGATPHKNYKNFCANCGADMRGKEE